ncbi:MAG: phosphate ABC transporter substrate-binding protein PstS [Gallionellales bacterium 35-53-114]|jgi:phosphate transport system substrate-binding protein|nr:MAG: phosphate ABC transporter substrate-binding protein PstS [Gallionellales bacterium 35-53-114]OYZ64361.1 MAG: phosphate ABC transporter substrate-binding protein PstS [Gallionellales bacterium 24-53-125]OZB10330.1 MAG: phosphate ABC transporter substrate-binding protein PstS [Gallionellales bacterium 39-52-133]HQS56934.1 phosphate ABC transporter substrate-binding protein PstS [Gallionellaceae bacterium]
MDFCCKNSLKYIVLSALVFPVAASMAAELPSKSQPSQPSIIIKGGGSQPISPLYVVWSKSYEARYRDVSMSYKISNVVKGIEDLEANKIDYAGSEIPLKADELKRKGLFQFPTALISFTPVANIPGVHSGQLRLDDAALAGIFLGTIKKWNDPRLVELNPKLPLPDAEINTVHRNSGNTITYVLSSYLSKVSPEWATKVGVGSTLNWPVGQEVGKGTNEDMMAYIKATPYSMGFTMLSLVLKNNLNLIKMKNRDGKFVSATPEGVMAASSNAKWNVEDGFYNILTDQPGAETWPFVMTGYATMKLQPANPQVNKTLLHFFDSGLKRGQIEVVSADLIPLPDSVATIIRAALKEQHIGSQGGK